MAAIIAKFYDGITAVSQSVNIKIANESLIISGDGKELASWQYSEIIIADRQRGIFSYELTSKARLIIEDTTTIETLLKKLPAKKNKKINWRFVTNCITLIIVVTLMIFIIIPSLSPMALPYIPRKWDHRLGVYVSNYYIKALPECKGEDGKKAFNTLIGRLTAHIDSPYQYQVQVINLPTVNALSFPGGYIVVFQGLIKEAKDSNELAGIMAHEIGHSEKRHGMEMLVRSLSTTFILDIMTGGGGTALYLGTQLRDLKYSVFKEREADNFAFKLMQQENINPLGMANFFAHMRESAQKEHSWLNDKTLQFLSDHPDDSERMTAAKKSYNSQRQYQPIMTESDWKSIKSMCEKH